VFALNEGKLQIRLSPATQKEPDYPKALFPEEENAGVVLTLLRQVQKKKQ
jgi:hypothetical protein